MKKTVKLILFIIIAVVFFQLFPAFAAAQDGQDLPFRGSGTEDEPYLITSADDLLSFAECVAETEAFRSSYFKQVSDIDLSGISWTPIGNVDSYFSGVYDGGGHCIDNILCRGYSQVGLFGCLGGTVINLGIRSGSFEGDCCGSFANASAPGTSPYIINCYSNADISGSRAGGIADNFDGGTIIGCFSNGTLNGEVTGGIVSLSAAYVADCVTTHDVIAPSGVNAVDCSAVRSTTDKSVISTLEKGKLDAYRTVGVSPLKLYLWQLDEDGAVSFSDETYNSAEYLIVSWFYDNYTAIIRGSALILVLLAILFFFILTKRKHAAYTKAKQKLKDSAPLQRLLFYSKILLCLLAFSGIVVFFILYKLQFIDALKFFAFIVLYIVLPGYILIRKFGKAYGLSTMLTLCTVMGLAILLASYCLCSLVGTFIPLYIISPCIACASVVFFISDVRHDRINTAQLTPDPGLCSLILFLTLYAFILRASYGMSPELMGYSNVFADSAFIAGNSSVMTQGLFAEFQNLSGVVFRYHYLSNVFQACSIRVTGISAMDTYMTYWTFFYIPFTACSVHSLCVQYSGTRRFGTLGVLITFCSAFLSVYLLEYLKGAQLPSGLDGSYKGSLWLYFLVFPNGIDIAMPTIAGAGMTVIMMLRRNCKTALGSIVLFSSVFIATGSKTPFGICFAAACAVTILFCLAQRKRPRDLKIPALIALTAIAAVATAYLAFINDTTGLGRSSFSLFNIADSRSTLKLDTLLQKVIQIIRYAGFDINGSGENILLLIMLPLSVFSLLPFTMPAFFSWFVAQLKRFRSIPVEGLILGGTAICGLTAYYILGLDGYSQLYFYFSGILFIQVIGFHWLTENFDRFSIGVKALFSAFLISSLFFPVCDGVQRMRGVSNQLRHMKYYEQHNEVPASTWDRITYYEYEGMRWIRENTPGDALIAVDRFSVSDPAGIDDILDYRYTYFYYGAYCERNLLVGGYAYCVDTEETRQYLLNKIEINDALYDPEVQNRASLMREHGVSYIAVSEFTHPGLKFYEPELKKVFSNRDITVYALDESAGAEGTDEYGE